MVLRIYWFKPTVTQAYLFKDVRCLMNGGMTIFPKTYAWTNSGACLISRLDSMNGLVKAYLFTFKRAEDFQNPSQREKHGYWLSPSCLSEMALT